jgi:hypothetical protein
LRVLYDRIAIQVISSCDSKARARSTVNVAAPPSTPIRTGSRPA